MNKIFYSWNDIETAAISIQLQMYKDNWLPDRIVGISRGGLPLALILSHMLSKPLTAIHVSLRDSKDENESNLWLSEESIGYVSSEEREWTKSRWDISKRSNILIVDDINDTGATFNWIKKDWRTSCFPNEEAAWNSVWHKNVRFATITNNLASEFNSVDYYWHEVNKAENDVWLVYPWEVEAQLKICQD